jgi:Niemann-Pick C1 protein
MGPAVFNGGFSTFLAFALLMTSSSHVFLTFFKIFFLVVIFGLFNGLVFLPVVLSLIGPGSTSSEEHGASSVAPVEQAQPYH